MPMNAAARTESLPWLLAWLAALAVHMMLFGVAVAFGVPPASGVPDTAMNLLVLDAQDVPREERITAEVPLPMDAGFCLPLPQVPKSAGSDPERSAVVESRYAALTGDLPFVRSVESQEEALPERRPGRAADAGADLPFLPPPLAAGTGSTGSVFFSPNDAAGSMGSGTSAVGRSVDMFEHIGAKLNRGPRAAEFRLRGEPDYPRACRQGLCRNGQACEGTSEWHVTVGPAGGRPQRVEAVRRMGCELQNAAIRQFFAGYSFPKTGRSEVYVFPVEMITRR